MVLLALALGGCYRANQTRFEQSVHGQVSVGMPLQTAVTNVGKLKLECTGVNPLYCTRIRDGLMPYSCLERVVLHWSDPDRTLSAVDIPPIACTSL